MTNDLPTELTIADIDAMRARIENGDLDLKLRHCFKCGEDFLPNYDFSECDECYFSKFPKDQVEIFCRSFFE